MKYVNSDVEQRLVEAYYKGDPWLTEDKEDDSYCLARYEVYSLSEQAFTDLYSGAGVDPEEAAAWLSEYCDSEVFAHDELLAEHSTEEEVLI